MPAKPWTEYRLRCEDHGTTMSSPGFTPEALDLWAAVHANCNVTYTEPEDPA